MKSKHYHQIILGKLTAKSFIPCCVFSQYSKQILHQCNIYCKQYQQLYGLATLIAITGLFK